MLSQNCMIVDTAVYVVLYIRKSKKLEKGVTFETQFDRCVEEAKRIFGENIIIVDFIEDDKSGDDVNRPKYNQMKKFIKNNRGCILYSYAINRIVRDVIEGAELAKFLRQSKCPVYIYEAGKFELNTPEGLNYFIANCNTAEVELNRNKKNQVENAFKKAEMSIKTGCQPAYGYDSNSREIFINNRAKNESYYVYNEIEIYNVIKIYSLYIKYKSISKVEKIMKENCVLGKCGNFIGKTTIRSILENPVNVKTNQDIVDYFSNKGYQIGRIEFGKGGNTYGKNSNAEFLNDKYRKMHFFTLDHEVVIEAEEWLKVQRILNDNTNKAPKKGKSKKSSLSKLLQCKCGADMNIVTMKKDKNGKDIIYYGCSKKCGNKNINGTDLEEKLFKELIFIDNLEVATEMQKVSNNVLQSIYSDYRQLKKERQYIDIVNTKLIKKISIINENLAGTTCVLNQSIEDNLKKINEIDTRVKVIEREMDQSAANIKKYIAFIENGQSIDKLLDYSLRKEVLCKMFEKIVWDSDLNKVYIDKKNKI